MEAPRFTCFASSALQKEKIAVVHPCQGMQIVNTLGYNVSFE